MCSPRSMAKLRGKAQHQFRCLEGVRPFLSRFDRFIGGLETVYEWDLEKEVPGELHHVMGFPFQQLPSLREAGAEMWPLEPSTAYFRWSKGLPNQYGDLVVATWDASVHGTLTRRAVFSSTILKLRLNTRRYLWRRTQCFWSISEELIRRRHAAGKSACDVDGSSGGNHTRRRSSRSCGESRRPSTEAWWRNQFFNAKAPPKAH